MHPRALSLTIEGRVATVLSAALAFLLCVNRRQRDIQSNEKIGGSPMTLAKHIVAAPCAAATVGVFVAIVMLLALTSQVWAQGVPESQSTLVAMVEFANDTLNPMTPPEVPFSARRVKLQVLDQEASALIARIAVSASLLVPDTVIAMIPVERLPLLDRAGIQYTSVQPSDVSPDPTSAGEEVLSGEEPQQPSALAAGTNACSTKTFPANTFMYSQTGDVQIPGDCGGTGVHLSPGMFSGAAVSWMRSLRRDPCADAVTSICVSIDSYDDCTICVDGYFVCYNWRTGNYDYSWRIPKSSGWKFLACPDPYYYVSSGGLFEWGVSVAAANDFCVWQWKLEWCYNIKPPLCYKPTTTLTFPKTIYPNCSPTQSFIIRNDGCGYITGPITSSNSEFRFSPTSINLSAGMTATVTVNFCPSSTACGTRTATISTPCGSVSCSAEGSNPAKCRVSTTSLSFQQTEVGQSRQLSFTLYNDGCEPLSGPISESCSDYSVSPSTVNITGGGSQLVTVTFAPVQGSCGTKNCTITVPGGCSVAASGQATYPPGCSISQSSLAFGQVNVGQTKDLCLTVTNTGCATLSGSVSSNCSDFTIVSGSPISLGAGQSAQVCVRFTPSTSLCGPRQCVLTLPTPCATVPLSGEALCPGTIRGVVYGNDGATGQLNVPVVIAGCGYSQTVITQAGGLYERTDVPLNCTYSVTPTLAGHTFDPTSASCALSVASPVCTKNFIDRTTFTVGGYVRYTTCNNAPVSGVTIIIDGGTSVSTDATGHWSAVVTPGMHSFKAEKSGHWFQAQNPQSHDIQSNRNDINFVDETQYQVCGRVMTGCGVGIQSVQVCLSDPALPCNACVMSDATGNYCIAVPPGTYTASAAKAGYTFPTATITVSGPTNHDFVPVVALKLVVQSADPGDPACPSKPFLESGQTHVYQICVFDEFNCPVQGATIRIIDEVSALSEGTPTPKDSVLVGRSCFQYTIKGGLVAEDRVLSMQVSKSGYDNARNQHFSKFITVTGRRWVGETFTVQLPNATPLMILYDPPGDCSYSEWLKSTTYSLGFGLRFGLELGGSISTHVGVSEIIPIDIGVDQTLSITAKMKSQYDYALEMTRTETYRTGENPDPRLIGPGGGTHYIAAGLKLKYGKALDLSVNTAQCAVVMQEVLSFEPEPSQNDVIPFYGSEWSIRNVIMPPLSDADSAQWERMLALDVGQDCAVSPAECSSRLINCTPKEELWCGGSSHSYSNVQTVTKSVLIDAELVVDYETAVEFGLDILEVVEAGVTVKVRAQVSLGGYLSGGVSHTNSLTYVLCDDEPVDCFHTMIYRDSVFGAPLFINGEGTTTMCPWEHCSTKNENVDLINASGYWVDTVCPGEAAFFDLRTLFTGILSGGSSFCITAPPSQNLCGAAVSFNGVPNSLCGVDVGINDTFKVTVAITPNCACNGGVNTVVICAASECDPQIYSCETFTVICKPDSCECPYLTQPAASGTYHDNITVCASVPSNSNDGIKFFHHRVGGALSLICYDQTPEGAGPYTYCCEWASGQDGTYKLISVPVEGGLEDWTCSDTITVMIDNTHPVIVRTWPARDSCYRGIIKAEFSELMECATIDCGSFTLYDLTDGQDVDCDVITCTDRIHEYFPTNDLDSTHDYEACISTTATDRAGNPVLAQYCWVFAGDCDTIIPPCPFPDPIATQLSGLLRGQAAIDGMPASSGDCIAAFDSKNQCVGRTDVVEAAGCSGPVRFSMQIYGNDPTTSGVDEGMDPGESFMLKLYDASEGRVLTLGPLGCWTNTNGSPLPPPCGDPCTMYDFPPTECMLDVNLITGWNLVSFCDVALDTAPLQLFQPLGSNLVWVSGFKGGYGWCDPTDPVFSCDLRIESGYGYWVKVGAPASIHVTGPCLDPSFCVPLVAGWNLIGYWQECPMAPEVAFASLISQNKLLWISGFDNGYKWFDPKDPFGNTLTSLECGMGYWVKVTEALPCFTWPPCPAPTSAGAVKPELVKSTSAADLAPFVFTPTLQACLVSGAVTIDGSPATDGDLVAAFDAGGHCAGAARISRQTGNARFALQVYGDDPTTPTIDEGLTPDDAFILRLYVSETGELLDYPVQFKGWENTNGSPLDETVHNRMTLDFHAQDAAANSVPGDYILGQNYPNPFNPSTTIELYLKQGTQVELSIFNVAGQRVRTLVDGYVGEGRHVYVWNGTDDIGRTMPSGVYFYRVVSTAFRETKKLVLLR